MPGYAGIWVARLQNTDVETSNDRGHRLGKKEQSQQRTTGAGGKLILNRQECLLDRSLAGLHSVWNSKIWGHQPVTPIPVHNLLACPLTQQILGPQSRPVESDSQAEILGLCTFETSPPGAS